MQSVSHSKKKKTLRPPERRVVPKPIFRLAGADDPTLLETLKSLPLPPDSSRSISLPSPSSSLNLLFVKHNHTSTF